MTRRCDRNRNRSKRRAIYCPIHSCDLDSVSRKYRIDADKFLSRRTGSLLISKYRTVPIKAEWLEAFWCQECQQRNWYYIRHFDDGRYEISLAPRELWQQVTGLIDSQVHGSMGDFTRMNARL
ncbi:hypothetical protein [Anabaena sp. CS-542/02]|uniref:hypothetical protein n=1 Tax=Anabaena sp. CS-542/02 TaxID=3021719 RepID=UPI00233084A2|nr:hypothetical protein [Anabaena sp. CS-542/02]MDB9445944.1 hypothetical protein [Anabaena sp. CS-542/02]